MQPEFSPTDPAHNACVHAAAGTGKTWQLVTRIIRLLLSGANPAGILAVTFTRKAAAEMMERLGARLREIAAADDTRLNDLLEEIGVTPDAQTRSLARTLYEATLLSPHPLRATTFHAFCQEVLQRFPLEAGVPPGFELLESDAGLRRAAWDALFDELTSTSGSMLAGHMDALFDTIGSLDSTRKSLDSFLDSRIDWWAYCHGQANAVDFASSQLISLLGIVDNADPAADFFSTARCATLGEFAELLGRHNTPTNISHQSLIHESLSPDHTAEDRLARIQNAFLTQSGSPRKRTLNATLSKKLGDTGAGRMIELHQQLCGDIINTQDRLARMATWQRTVDWYHAGQRLLEHFQQLKRERRELDFSDLEWHAYTLLANSDNAHWVQYKLDTRIDHLLIDEFQDTNPTQWRLLLPLLEELAAGIHTRQRSVFLVGDAKQSIYRFRRADAGLLHAATHWLGEHLNAGTYTLDASRRSSPAIIEFVNRVFGHGTLRERLPDFRHHSTHLTDLWGRVEILPMVEAQTAVNPDSIDAHTLRNPLTSPRQVEEDLRHFQEGVAVARRIQVQIESRLPVADDGIARPIRYSDILILLRSRTHLSAYEQALRDAGIPYIGGGRGSLLESLEVRDMEALLNTLVAPWNNLSLAQVLRSPLFSLSDDELAQLAASGSGAWIDHLYERAKDLPDEHGMAAAAACLSRWHTQVGVLPMHDLLDRIYYEGDVIKRFTAGFPAPLRPRVRANLTRFLELALEVDSGRYPSLPHFLERLQDLRNRSADAPDDAPPDSTSGERVRIITIHSAKGLEAPSVFLVDSASTRRANPAWRALVDWPSGQTRPASILLNGRKEELDAFSRDQLERQNHADAIEEANLLYVALTRARQYLVVSASAQGKDTGWYGFITGNCGDPDTSGSSCEWTIRHGAFPETTDEMIKRESVENTIDPALARQLNLKTCEREIAPSRETGDHLTTTTDDADARRRGIAIHRFIDLLSRDPAVPPDQAISIVAREHQREVDDPELVSWLDEAAQTCSLQEFRHLFSADCYETSQNEVSVSYMEGDILVHGIIDRVIIRDTHVDIVDYKTHRLAQEDIAGISARYHEQLILYARAAAQLWPILPVRAWLLFTASRQLVEVPLELT